MNDDKELQQLLKRAFTQTAETERDLWPQMQERLERPRLPAPWFEWAMAAAALGLIAFAPTTIPILLYWL